MATLNANLENVQAQTFEIIPPGDYSVIVADTAMVQTKAGAPMLKVTYEIAGPTHTGRKLFDNFLIGNQVAMSRLKTMATVGGHHNPSYIQDSEELHGMKFVVRIKVENDVKYGEQNKITSFKPLNGNGGNHGAPPPVAMPPANSAISPNVPTMPKAQPPASTPPSSGPKMPWG